MTATTASNGPRTQTPTNPAADRTTGASGPEVMAEALPFETIPAEILRGHFTRWLTDSLARIARRPAPTAEAEHPPESGRIEVEAAEPGSGPTAPETEAKAPKPKRPKAKNRPPSREREGPLADAMEPPQVPDATVVMVEPLRAADATAAVMEPLRVPDAAAVAIEPPRAPAPDPRTKPAAPRRRQPTASVAQDARLAADAEAGGLSRIAAESDPAEPPSPPPRPQYVRVGDRSVWLTKPMLRSRGWTEAAIRDFLPGPEALKPNPRFAISGAPMPVWKPGTVARAEADPKWRDWLDRSLQRRQTTLDALAGTDDQEFQNRLELADQAIRDCSEPPTLLDGLEPERPLATAGS